MSIDEALRKLGRAVKLGDRFAATSTLESRPDGFIEAALARYPQLLADWAPILVGDEVELPPKLVATCLAHYRRDGAGEWFGGWGTSIDQIVATAYFKDPTAFVDAAGESDAARLGLELVKIRAGEPNPEAAAELRPLILNHLAPTYYPRVVVASGVAAPVRIDSSGTPLLAPVFASVFDGEEGFTRALRAWALSSFDGPKPRRDLIPLILNGANDDELKAILVAGEKAGVHKLYFHSFAEAVRRAEIGVQRLLAIASHFEPGENGASLAAWAVLISGGAPGLPEDLDRHLDFAPCDVRTVDASGCPLGDLPAMQGAIAELPLDRLPKIVEVSMTARPTWPAGWRSSRYITSFAFVGSLDDGTLLDRLIAERQEALDAVAQKPIADRLAVASAWEAASFAGQNTAIRLLERARADHDFATTELAFLVLQVSAAVAGFVIAGADELLDFAVDFELHRLAKLLPLMDSDRRGLLLDRALEQGAYFYGELLAEVFEPDRLYRLPKKKAREAALAVLDQLQDREELALQLDACFPDVVARLGLKLSADERDLYEGILGEKRFRRWWP